MKEHNGMKSQDVAILLYILLYCEVDYKVLDIAHNLKISQSEISESLNRSSISGLIDTRKKKIRRKSLYEFIIYGLQYVFPVNPGAIVRGIPTAHSGPPLNNKIISNEDTFVWNCSKGESRGMEIKPLYRTLPEVSLKFKDYYEILCLIDSIRTGRAREIMLAREILKERILGEKQQ